LRIGNPLTGIASIAQNLDYDRDSDAVSESAGDILDQVDRINGIVKSLLAFSRSDVSLGSDRNTLDLRDCIREAIRLVRLDEQAKNIQFIEDINSPLPVNVNAQQLVQVFVNLVQNACYASPQKEPITLQGEISGAYFRALFHHQAGGRWYGSGLASGLQHIDPTRRQNQC